MGDFIMKNVVTIRLERQDYCIKYGYKKTAGIDGKIEGENFYWGGKLHQIANHVKVRYQDTPEGEFQASAKTAYERYSSGNPKRDLIRPRAYRHQDFNKELYLLLNIKREITGTWHLSYGLTEDRQSALPDSSHNDGLTNPNSETSLTLFVLGNADNWEQIENLAVLPRTITRTGTQQNVAWNRHFFDNVRSERNNFHPNRKKVNHLWDVMLADNLYESDCSALNNSYLLFEFEIMNSKFHSISTGVFKKLSFFDIASKPRWSQFDALLILPTIKRLIFIESKLWSDVSETTTEYPINQICRNLESAFLLTNHGDSLYRDWDFAYLFISPSEKYNFRTKNYETYLNIFQNGEIEPIESLYTNKATKSYRKDNNEYFDSFCGNISKHIYRFYWDQLGNILNNERPKFFENYFRQLSKKNIKWSSTIKEKFQKVGLV